MRFKAILAVALAVMAASLMTPPTAEAGGLFRDRHAGHDPYAYRYEPRGYYPYYNSRYWRPAHEMRKSRKYLPQAPYYQAWGYPKRNYHHRQWHRRNHGRIRLGHW